jgi:hypothetical protein
MNEQNHDPIVTLRLELARVTDQRDAYEKALRTEVLKLLEQVTVSVALATDKEILRLKAEVEELKSQPDPTTAFLYAAELAKDDVKRLKAEVARLQLCSDNWQKLCQLSKAEADKLKEDNQQLQARLDFLEDPRS